MAKDSALSLVNETHEPHAKQSLRLWLRLLAATTVLEKSIRAYLKSNCNSTLPRFDVLAALDRASGKVTMSQLSERLLVSNGNVTGVVSRLVDDGLVVRQTDPNDRRTQFASLTKLGQKTFRQMAKEHELLVDDLLSDISDADMDQLLDLIARLNHSVHQKLEPHRKVQEERRSST